ncbi:MAG TPA: GNAT family N-acetyltransferase [Candidatus Paenibacillus intestinavium]|nr:GNAT family N-acetyltransferase [Candidatus Paenibacillus intestinavium]
MTQFILYDSIEMDEPFMYEVYASTREEEMKAWGWGSQEQAAFLRMQYDAQCRSYLSQYPSLGRKVIIYENERVGRLLTALTGDGLTIVDIAILPNYRRRRIGTAILEQVCREAELFHIPIRLSVRYDNQAIRLYYRLGFKVVSRNEMTVFMEK